MENIIIEQDFFGDFRATTEENYNARISDDRKVWKFNQRDGFTSLEKVKEYITKWFKVPEENIIIIKKGE